MKDRPDPRKQRKLERKLGIKTGPAPRRENAAATSTLPPPPTTNGRFPVRFEALDTWFFRESRPMDAIGGSELTSVFPPPPRTLMGAVRTAIGDQSEVDWAAFAADDKHPLRQEIGYADNLGPMRLFGPWLCQGSERLYPTPLLLMLKTEGDQISFARLRIGRPANTHLGNIRLPELPAGQLGFRPSEHCWLTRPGLEAVLAGGVPHQRALRQSDELFTSEARLGIARDSVRKTTDDGLLYQTRHLRPKAGLAIEADVGLLTGTLPPGGLARLGGEGRLSHLSIAAPSPMPSAPKPIKTTKGLIVVLATPALFAGARWLPDGFVPRQVKDGTDQWRGQIAGIELTLHAAIVGKAQREGGWDMANRKPRSVCSLVPAGSAYYVTTENLQLAIDKIHGTQIGGEQNIGRGIVFCGLWNDYEY